MGSSRASAALLCGILTALLGCAESRTQRADPDRQLGQDGGGLPAFDAAVIDSGGPITMDASGAMSDAAPTTGLDASVVLADSSSEASVDGAMDAPAPFRGEVRLEVLTKPSPMSRYEPINVLAIWVEDEIGTPIKVIGRWAGNSQRALEIFNSRVPGAFSGIFGSPVDGGPGVGDQDPDVITTATLHSHEPHDVTWDLTDYMGTLVPDGTYLIFIETNDGTGESGLAMVELRKGAEPMSFEQGEVERFAYIRMTYTPLGP